MLLSLRYLESAFHSKKPRRQIVFAKFMNKFFLKIQWTALFIGMTLQSFFLAYIAHLNHAAHGAAGMTARELLMYGLANVLVAVANIAGDIVIKKNAKK